MKTDTTVGKIRVAGFVVKSRGGGVVREDSFEQIAKLSKGDSRLTNGGGWVAGNNPPAELFGQIFKGVQGATSV